MADRIIEVPVVPGVVAKVRVLSQHPEDDDARKQLYRATAYWTWADKQIERAEAEPDATKSAVLIEQSVTAKLERDKARREAVKVALRKQQNDDEILELFKQCPDRAYLLILDAVQGEDPTLTVGAWIRQHVEALKLTPAELLALCYAPEQLQSYAMPPTAGTPPNAP